MNTGLTSLQTVLQQQLTDPQVAEAYYRHRHEIALVMQIIETRKAQHLSQNDLARKAGVRQQVVSRIECHKTYPNLKTLIKLTEALNLSMILVENPVNSPHPQP